MICKTCKKDVEYTNLALHEHNPVYYDKKGKKIPWKFECLDCDYKKRLNLLAKLPSIFKKLKSKKRV